MRLSGSELDSCDAFREGALFSPHKTQFFWIGRFHSHSPQIRPEKIGPLLGN